MRYEDIYIGQKESLSHKVTQSDIEKFVDLSGDDNKLHVNKEFAAKTSFKKPVVHGMIGASFISTIIGTKIPGDGALWYSQTLEFLLPVRVGDQITVIAEVIKKIDRDRAIELNVEIQNQNRQVVTRGVSKVKIIEELEKAVEEIKEETVNKVALVIGSTGGIGTAVAKQLADDGYDVVLHYFSNKDKAISVKKAIEEKGKGKAVTIQADINNEESVKELISQSIREFYRIDFLVNCASVPIPNIKVEDLKWDDFSKQFDLNIKANLLLTQTVLPQMLEHKYGKIIFVSSEVTDQPSKNWTHYTTAKSALEGFARSLAFDLAPSGIRVNMVSPGLISTDLTANIPEKIKLLSAMQTPLRRLALPEDVAGAVSFLASEKSDYLSGEVIRINGGQVMK